MRRVVIENSASEDLYYWAKTDLKLLKKIIELIEDTRKNPFDGIGKPKPLKHDFKGFWSRRINDEHRLVNAVTSNEIIIASCRFHYTK